MTTVSKLGARCIYQQRYEGTTPDDSLLIFIIPGIILLGISLWYERKRIIAHRQLTDKNDMYDSEK